MKTLSISLILAASALCQPLRAASILDVKHTITDDNIIPPESFETKARELEENFYLTHYAKGQNADAMPQKLGTAAEYEERLAKIPAEIEMPYNSVVGKYIDMYVGKRRGMVSDLLALHNYYGNIFLEELEKEGLPTELQYLPIIESALKPEAVSRAGAAGLWQFMPATARGLGMEVNSLVDERRDPRSSSRNAAKYLKQLHEIYNDWSLAIAAYNCGPGNVNKALRRAGGGKQDFWEIYRFLPAETRGYVPAFIAANYAMNYHQEHNISPRVVSRHLVTDTVMVNKRVHFNQISHVLNIPVEEIRMLNPQYRKDVIPGDIKPYPLVLPSQQVLSYVMSEPQILAYDADIYARRTYVEPRLAGEGDEDNPFVTDPGAEQPDMAQSDNAQADLVVAQNFSDKPVTKTHTVARGESLRDIARLYGVSATDIKRWNGLRRGKVKEGDKLTIETYEAEYNMTLAQKPASSSASSSRSVAVPERPVSDSSLTASTNGAVPPPPAKTVQEQPTVPAPPAKQTVVGSATNPDIRTSAASDSTPRTPARRVYGEQSQPRPVTQSATASSASAKKQVAATSSKSSSKKKDTTSTSTKNKKKTKTYTVKKGDTLASIARKNGTTVAALQKANGIKGSNIRTGQTIKIL